MEKYSRSAPSFHFPCEIRDLIYSFITPREEIYAISCVGKTTLAQAVFNARPDLRILWTSKAVQHEFLEILCATNTFRFPIYKGDAFMLEQPLTQHQANLMQHVEIDFDVTVNITPALRMFRRNKARRKICFITISNDYALSFPHNLFNAVVYVVGFETVVVMRTFEEHGYIAARLQFYMEAVLGPSSICEGVDFVRYKFHPRNFYSRGVAR